MLLAADLAQVLRKHPNFEVKFELGMRRFSLQIGDIDYNDKRIILGPTSEDVRLVCDCCGRVEGPPYDVGDGCYEACGGTFLPAGQAGRSA